MRTYTLHCPEIVLRGDARGLDRAQVVPDGFSWSAFAFSVLWFVRHGLWLAAIGVLAFLAALALAGALLGLSTGAGVAIALLASVLIGLEASSLRRWTYARQGRPARDAVIAASADEAEAKAVARWLDPAAVRASANPYPVARRIDDGPLGFFPASEGGR